MPIKIIRNDITKMPADAIVNAAKNSLLGGGGVDGAIHRAAGPRLLEECRKLGGCRTGEAKLTAGYDLPCKYVIHTVGPVWQGGNAGEEVLLASCYRSSLALAEKHHCETIAFPMISTGAYGFPKAPALKIAVETITDFLLKSDMLVYIVVFEKDAVELGGHLFSDIVSYIDDVYVEEHTDHDREARRNAAFGRPQPFLSDSAPSMPEAFEKSAAMPLAEEEYSAASVCEQAKPAAPAKKSSFFGRTRTPSLDDMLSRIDESFRDMLIRKIDEKRMTDAECYKRANIDRRLFNKIKNNPGYRPGKQTVLAFAIALELTLEETQDMLMKAGFALSHSSKADIVVEYCILNRLYNIMEINEVLFRLDLQPLGY